jgi:hypothetical protein
MYKMKVVETRAEFWKQHPEFKSEYRTAKKHNDYNATIQFAFSCFIDRMQKEGRISVVIAGKATL